MERGVNLVRRAWGGRSRLALAPLRSARVSPTPPLELDGKVSIARTSFLQTNPTLAIDSPFAETYGGPSGLVRTPAPSASAEVSPSPAGGQKLFPWKSSGFEIPLAQHEDDQTNDRTSSPDAAARLQSPKRTSADAYAQLDRFLRGSDTEQNGEQSSNGAKKQA